MYVSIPKCPSEITIIAIKSMLYFVDMSNIFTQVNIDSALISHNANTTKKGKKSFYIILLFRGAEEEYCLTHTCRRLNPDRLVKPLKLTSNSTGYQTSYAYFSNLKVCSNVDVKPCFAPGVTEVFWR